MPHPNVEAKYKNLSLLQIDCGPSFHKLPVSKRLFQSLNKLLFLLALIITVTLNIECSVTQTRVKVRASKISELKFRAVIRIEIIL